MLICLRKVGRAAPGSGDSERDTLLTRCIDGAVGSVLELPLGDSKQGRVS